MRNFRNAAERHFAVTANIISRFNVTTLTRISKDHMALKKLGVRNSLGFWSQKISNELKFAGRCSSLTSCNKPKQYNVFSFNINYSLFLPQHFHFGSVVWYYVFCFISIFFSLIFTLHNRVKSAYFVRQVERVWIF